MPGLGELIEGKVSIQALRDVDYQDLLGRPPVRLDVEGVKSYIEGRRVMITGAGGSIGSELCRQIVPFNPNEIILLDASEGDLYTIQTEIEQIFSYQKHTSVLGSVRNRDMIGKTLTKFSPEAIFHAAAYKHVPVLELNPWQAVLNNIKGTQVLIEECLDHQVETFVLVSTDKAVRPTNVMGASKRICEMLLQSYAGGDTRMSAVRFGNVVGSSGSVIKLFRDQIRRGGPVGIQGFISGLSAGKSAALCYLICFQRPQEAIDAPNRYA